MTIPYASNYDKTLAFCDVCSQIGLSANDEVHFTVPGLGNAVPIQYVAVFEYASNANVYVANNKTAVVPALGSETALPYVEYKPVQRFVREGDVLSFITPDAMAYVGVTFRSIL